MPKSRFNKGAQGWTIGGDVRTFEWQASGGHPGGHLYWEDAASGDDTYWEASAKFTGHKGKFLGGTFSYDAQASGSDYSGVPDVTIAGANGTTLVAVAGQPGTGWTHFSLALDASGGWHVGTLDGAAATTADIRGVLRNIASVEIRAEYVWGNETGGLDNVVMSKPAQALALAFGDDTAAPVHFHAAAAFHDYDLTGLALA